METQFNPFESTATEKVRQTIQKWQEYLISERRLSLLTAESYLEDLKEFFTFLLDALGKEIDLMPLSLKALLFISSRSLLLLPQRHTLFRFVQPSKAPIPTVRMDSGK